MVTDAHLLKGKWRASRVPCFPAPWAMSLFFRHLNNIQNSDGENRADQMGKESSHIDVILACPVIE